MFCQKCGTKIPDNATACPSCSTAAPLTGTAAPAGPSPASMAADRVKAASKDALQALKLFALNPVGGLQAAYEGMGSRALAVGMVFGAFCSLCILLDLLRLVSGWHIGFGGYLKLVVVAIVPFVTLFGSCFLVRLVFGGGGGVGSDSFITGASLLPFAVVALLGAIFSVSNADVLTLFMLFATCIPVLMLYAGLTRICQLSERAATIAVPLMLLLSAWLTRTIYSKMLESAIMGSSPSFPSSFGNFN